MKTLLCATVLLMVSAGCHFNRKSPIHHCTTVVLDFSDEHLLTRRVTAGYLMRRSGLDENLFVGMDMNIRIITDLKHPESYSLSLPSAEEWESNELDRRHEVQDWVFGGDSLLRIVQSRNGETNGSEVFHHILTSLADIAACTTCTHRELLVFSDLRERSPLLNTYRPQQLDRIRQHPEEIGQLLGKHYPDLPPLNGITVTFIHQSRDKQEDEAFNVIAAFLKSYLEQRGASVTIQSHL